MTYNDFLFQFLISTLFSRSFNAHGKKEKFSLLVLIWKKAFRNLNYITKKYQIPLHLYIYWLFFHISWTLQHLKGSTRTYYKERAFHNIFNVKNQFFRWKDMYVKLLYFILIGLFNVIALTLYNAAISRWTQIKEKHQTKTR